jgi:hypothetical protein
MYCCWLPTCQHLEVIVDLTAQFTVKRTAAEELGRRDAKAVHIHPLIVLFMARDLRRQDMNGADHLLSHGVRANSRRAKVRHLTSSILADQAVFELKVTMDTEEEEEEEEGEKTKRGTH